MIGHEPEDDTIRIVALVVTIDPALLADLNPALPFHRIAYFASVRPRTDLAQMNESFEHFAQLDFTMTHQSRERTATFD